MPGIHIDFTEEEYNAIPRPKRTWIRDLVRERLGIKVAAVVSRIPLEAAVRSSWPKAEPIMTGVVVPESPRATGADPRATAAEPREFFFQVDGQVVSATAMRPADAALKLGIDGIPEWKTREEAETAGWFNAADPLEV